MTPRAGAAAGPLARRRIRVSGIVQGVGFRPFVYGLAGEYGLVGFVGNDESGVLIEAEGDPAALAEFTTAVAARAPALAVVTEVAASELPVRGESGFTIAPSRSAGPRRTLVSPDTATCADCLAELADPTDRRYRYPFINCTNCGPRLTIVTDVPYDRPFTTMARFPMCPACAAEYHDPADRRFHAQPVCCPACGPALRFVDAGGAGLGPAGDPLAAAVAALRAGAVVAVKGLGGYHLATLARDERAVGALRARKHREDKPFAVLAADLAAAGELVEVDEAAAAELTSRRAPIVLLPRRPGARVAPSVAPGNRNLGVLLPYTGLHHRLAAELAEPIVLTSGNVSDEPIAYRDDEAARRLAPIADAMLGHDRAIHIRADDSVIRMVGGRALPIRRSRGYAPEPVPLATPAARPVLGCGAELKSTFCLALAGGRSCPTTSATWRTPRRCARSPRGWRTTAGCSTSRPSWSRTTCTRSTCPPSTPWSCRTCGWSGCSTTTPTWPPAWPTTAWPGRWWGWLATGSATAPTARSGAAR